MWFRQAHIFELARGSFRPSAETLAEQLDALAFSPCLPSMPLSLGWVPPAGEEDARRFRMINDCIMLCLEIEEKILPASIIKQFLHEKVKKIETEESRKVYNKEKMALKDEVIMTLLPRAFGRRQRIYGYIDVKQQWLVVGSASPKRTEQFVTLFKKTLSEEVTPVHIDALSERMTGWLKQGEGEVGLSVGDACVLQDRAQQGRVIRCRQQDLFQEGIQSLLKTGCAVRQLAMTWQDQVDFILTDPFVLQGIRFQEEVIARSRELEPETAEQQFDANFFIFSSLFRALFENLLQMAEGEKQGLAEAVA